MDKRKARRIAYGMAADMIASSQAEFVREEYDDKDADKILEQLEEIVDRLYSKSEREGKTMPTLW